jgi:uncharacterized phage-associated protein
VPVTPGERLQVAADRLEALLKAATHGPWMVDEKHGRDMADEGWSSITIRAPRENGMFGPRPITVGEFAVDDLVEDPQANAYLSATLRQMAPLIAKQLRDVIAHWDETTRTYGTTIEHETDWCDLRIVINGKRPERPEYRCVCFDDTLALANAILGGAA